jgi:hydroxyacyl-ACP dehydratase HTD2-like protein with hotdog domain
MRSAAYRKACQIGTRPVDQGARLALSVVRANLSQPKIDQRMPWWYLFRVAFSPVCRMDGDHTVRRVPSFGYTYRVSFLNAKLPATLSRRMKLNGPFAFQDTNHLEQTSGFYFVRS